jgi:hypothetical protein
VGSSFGTSDTGTDVPDEGGSLVVGAVEAGVEAGVTDDGAVVSVLVVVAAAVAAVIVCVSVDCECCCCLVSTVVSLLGLRDVVDAVTGVGVVAVV